ncbi:lysylphosphatidylglycerol synthase transmembrane domain-containing protein [Variovorax sp. J31P207]|uniref:lysylphosphatidylglycerol synthase transmembrane domain-containing protein n=1 Tax=Variovorax sp. J31P207 TaxID=3053510 RepID=UPI002574E4AD|nr:lysylphosphatidylglycerol synthase transmembrane domain-containing protein [Variovorax sp. J31P207]MDM0067673.1 lysylphosphatidylglycerol synthase transmembrane domain-containing protein [Variovorax sp. J31P207]
MSAGESNPRTPPSRDLLGPQFVRRLVFFVLAGAALYLGAALWSGRAEILQALGLLGVPAMLAAAGVASISFFMRFARWHAALSWMGSRVPVAANLTIYLSGLALTASPGKVGETIRSVLLAPRGVPVSRSLAAFLADRLSDVLGVCLLGAFAGWLGHSRFNYAGWALVVLLVACFLIRCLALHPPVLERCATLIGLIGRRPGRLLSEAILQWARLWSFRNAALFAFLAACAYGVQALVFAWICDGVGIALPLSRAVEIYVNATLLGAASMVPGGLGAMEASLVIQLVDHGTSHSTAVAAAIAVRLVTLWFAILMGLGCLARVTSEMMLTGKD